MGDRSIYKIIQKWSANLASLILGVVIAVFNSRLALLYAHDEVIPLSRHFIQNYFYTWFEKNIGIASAGGIPKLVSFVLFYVFPSALEWTEFMIILVGSYIGILYCYKLLSSWLGRERSLAAGFGAFFYVVNPFITYYIWRTNNLVTRFWFFSFIPLGLFYLQKYIKDKTSSALLLFCFAQVLILPSFTHPSFVIITGILYACLCINYVLSSKERIARKVTTCLILGVCFLGINSIWVLPRIFTIADELLSAASVGLATSLIKNSSKINLARVMIALDFSSFYEGNTWYEWQSYFLSGMATFSGYLLLLLSATGLFLRRKTVRTHWMMFFIFLLSSFLAWGANSSELLVPLYNRFPFLYAFRDPGKWYTLMILPFCFLIASGLEGMGLLLANRKKLMTAVYLAVGGAMVLLGWPVLSGFAIRDQTVTFPGARIKVPSVYGTLKERIKDWPGRTLVLPLIGNHFTSNWPEGAYKGVYVLSSLTGASFITNSEPKHVEILKQAVADVVSGRQTSLLRILNVNRLIFHHDQKIVSSQAQELALTKEGIARAGYPVLDDNPYFTVYNLSSSTSNESVFAFSRLHKIDFSTNDSSYLEPGDFYVPNDGSSRNKDIVLISSILTKDIKIIGKKAANLVDLDDERSYKLAYSVGGYFYAERRSDTLSIYRGYTGKLSFNDQPSMSIEPLEIKKIRLNPSSAYFLLGKSSFVELKRGGPALKNELSSSSSLFSVGKNIVGNGSFESGLWSSKVGDCDKYDDNAIIGMALKTTDATKGSRSLELRATRHNACTSVDVSFSESGDYVMQFDYKNDQQNKFGYYLVFNDGSKTVIRDMFQASGGSWQTFTKMITAPVGAKGARLYLYAYAPNDGTESINLYDDIRIRKLIKVADMGIAEESRFQKDDRKTFASSSFILSAYEDDLYDYHNIIENGSFEDGLWGKRVSDCNNYDDRASIAMSQSVQSKSDGFGSLQLEAVRHNACTSIAVPVLGGHNYVFSFDYQSPNSDTASYYLGFNDKLKSKIGESIPINDSKWGRFSTTFQAPAGSSGVSLYVYARESDGVTPIINRYDNFKLIEVPDLRDAFYLVSEPERKLVQPSSITFDLINPTKKRVHIKGASTPFFLGMSESYHDQWQLQFNNAKVTGWWRGWSPFAKPDRIANDAHYKLDGFLNAWYVDTDELCGKQALCTKNADGTYDLEMVLEFWPQRWFYLGLLISGTTLAACLSYLGYDGVRSLRRRYLARKERKQNVSKAV